MTPLPYPAYHPVTSSVFFVLFCYFDFNNESFKTHLWCEKPEEWLSLCDIDRRWQGGESLLGTWSGWWLQGVCVSENPLNPLSNMGPLLSHTFVRKFLKFSEALILTSLLRGERAFLVTWGQCSMLPRSSHGVFCGHNVGPTDCTERPWYIQMPLNQVGVWPLEMTTVWRGMLAIQKDIKWCLPFYQPLFLLTIMTKYNWCQ